MENEIITFNNDNALTEIGEMYFDIEDLDQLELVMMSNSTQKEKE